MQNEPQDDWLIQPEIEKVLMHCPHCMAVVIREEGEDCDETAKEKALDLLTMVDGNVVKGTDCPKCGKEIINFCMEQIYAKEGDD